VAIEDAVQDEKVSTVMAYCYNSEVIPKYSKFELYYFFKADIKCGEKFNAKVKLTSLKDNKYKASYIGNSLYMNCSLKKVNYNNGSNSFLTALGDFRSYVKTTINNNYSSADAPIITAINTGDRSKLTYDFYTNVLVCGVSHLMVISGLHISIIIGSVFGFFEKFFYNRYLKAFLSLLAIFVLCAICGFTVSVVRAGTMFLFSAISPVFMRKNDSFNSLGSAVVLLLFISPLCIFSVAFWLSVLSTAAVVWISPFYTDLITHSLKIKSKVITKFISAVSISVFALIFTAPISALVFGEVSVLSPISYILLAIPVMILLVLNSVGILFSAFKVLSFVSEPLFYCAGLCSKYITFIINKLGKYDNLYIDFDATGFFIFAFLAFMIICLMYLYKYYQNLLKRNYIKEVYARARNNRKLAEKRAYKR
ncbi:MAG: ComEC/Rec2 family competence protein, partial [Clostridia bacterium]|nr:ComEC/Rec2 family competence protein [Clostridia bacterium]